MQFYTIAEGIYKSLGAPLARTGETVKVSIPIKYKDKLYRELAFGKTTLFGGFQVRGFLYATEEGSIVTGENVKRGIAALTFKASSLLQDKGIKKMKKIMIPERILRRDKEDLGQMIMAFGMLRLEGVKGIDIVESVFTRLIDYKIENNKAIERFIEGARRFKDEVITEENMEGINALHQETLMANFRKIILLMEGYDYYEGIRTATSRKNRLRLFTINGDFSGKFTRLEHNINYARKVISIYEPVINMTEREYVEFLKKLDRERIDDRLEMVRG